jgi:hypothetical protein
VPIPQPAILRVVDSQLTTKEVLGHEKKLAAYYQKVILLAKENELPVSAMQHHFWLRLWIWNSETETYLSFPWYDTLSEIDPILEALQSDREGTIFRDADQGWSMEVVADDQFFYFREIGGRIEGDGMVLVKTEKEDLRTKAKALQRRIREQIESLTALVGEDLWSA